MKNDDTRRLTPHPLLQARRSTCPRTAAALPALSIMVQLSTYVISIVRVACGVYGAHTSICARGAAGGSPPLTHSHTRLTRHRSHSRDTLTACGILRLRLSSLVCPLRSQSHRTQSSDTRVRETHIRMYAHDASHAETSSKHTRTRTHTHNGQNTPPTPISHVVTTPSSSIRVAHSGAPSAPCPRKASATISVATRSDYQ